EDGDFKEFLNPESLVVVKDARIEPSVRDTAPGTHYQFERLGYFFADPGDSSPGALVFNRVVTLRDTWAKRARAGAGARAGEAPAGPARARAARREEAAAPRAETTPGEHPRPPPPPRPGPAAAAAAPGSARARRPPQPHRVGPARADPPARAPP